MVPARRDRQRWEVECGIEVASPLDRRGQGQGRAHRLRRRPSWNEMQGAGRALVTGAGRSLSGPGPARRPQEDVTKLAQAGRSWAGGEGWAGTALLRSGLKVLGGGGTRGANVLLAGKARRPRRQPGGGAERDIAQCHEAPKDSSCRRVEWACGRGGQRPAQPQTPFCPRLSSSVVNPAGWPAEPCPHQLSLSPPPPPGAGCHRPCPDRFPSLSLLLRATFHYHAIRFLESQPCDATPLPRKLRWLPAVTAKSGLPARPHSAVALCQAALLTRGEASSRTGHPAPVAPLLCPSCRGSGFRGLQLRGASSRGRRGTLQEEEGGRERTLRESGFVAVTAVR